jgi:methanethiol oxidase
MVERLLPDPTYYPTPSEAMRAPPERIAYVAALYTGIDANRPDFIAVVDVDPSSASYGKVIARVELPKPGDELHHFGWNACSSMLCPYGNPTIERRYLVVPGLRSSDIHIIDTKPDAKNPRLVKTIPAEKIGAVTGYSRLHTVHCGPDGVYLSGLGSAGSDEGPGGVLVLDHYSFKPIGKV